MGEQLNYNYYEKPEFKRFIDYIEKKFDYIRYNHFKNRFMRFNQKFIAYQQLKEDINLYNIDSIKYLKEIIGINEVYDVMPIPISKKEVIDAYIKEHDLLDKELGKDDRAKILRELADKGIVNTKGEPYKLLKFLLEPYGYTSTPLDHNKGIYVIKKED